MRYLISLLLIILLTGCKVTQVPNWQSYGKEGRKTNFENSYKAKALLGDPESQMRLALIYYNDPQLSERLKAKTYFENNVKLDNESAMYFLSAGQLVGTFGEVSETEYLKYADIIAKKRPDFAKSYRIEKEQWEIPLNKNFESLKNTYDNAVELCEQTLPSLPKKLTPSSSYTAPKYLDLCLKIYSYNESVKSRLLALASFQQIICDGKKENGKTCFSVGYRNLANDNFPESDSDEYLQTSSLAMREIYSSHKRKYQIYTRNPNSVLPNSDVLSTVGLAFNQYKDNKIDDAINTMERKLSQRKITQYDRAYIEHYLGQIYSGKDSTQDRDTAIEYLERALSRNMLSPDIQHEMTEGINNLLLINKHYKKYLVNMSKILSQKEPQYYFLPPGTSQRIINAFAPETALKAPKAATTIK